MTRLLEKYEEYAIKIKATDEDMTPGLVMCGDESMEEEEIQSILHDVKLPFWYHATNRYMSVLQTHKIDIEHAKSSGVLGPGVYLSTIPEMYIFYIYVFRLKIHD